MVEVNRSQPGSPERQALSFEEIGLGGSLESGPNNQHETVVNPEDLEREKNKALLDVVLTESSADTVSELPGSVSAMPEIGEIQRNVQRLLTNPTESGLHELASAIQRSHSEQ